MLVHGQNASPHVDITYRTNPSLVVHIHTCQQTNISEKATQFFAGASILSHKLLSWLLHSSALLTLSLVSEIKSTNTMTVVLSHPPPPSFDVRKGQQTWCAKEYTLPATISFDAKITAEQDEILSVFSQTKLPWTASGGDTLSYYMGHQGFTFRFNGQHKYSPTRLFVLVPIPGKFYRIKCTITSTHTSYSIDGKDYGFVEYPIGAVPLKGFFGFESYSEGTVRNLEAFGVSLKTDIMQAIQKEWPAVQIVDQFYADRFYAGVPKEEAVEIWKKSDLSKYKWTKQSFDCDDFSYVYKGAVSKHVYATMGKAPFAVGVIFGNKPGSGHAVNVFLDELGNVKILEPQNGKIVDGKNWDYTPYFMLM